MRGNIYECILVLMSMGTHHMVCYDIRIPNSHEML